MKFGQEENCCPIAQLELRKNSGCEVSLDSNRSVDCVLEPREERPTKKQHAYAGIDNAYFLEVSKNVKKTQHGYHFWPLRSKKVPFRSIQFHRYSANTRRKRELPQRFDKLDNSKVPKPCNSSTTLQRLQDCPMFTCCDEFLNSYTVFEKYPYSPSFVRRMGLLLSN
jgi:hypothetical protein